MSRRTRPLRRVRGADLDRLRAGHWPAWLDRLERGGDGAWRWSLRVQARRAGCRPAQLRRCLLGLPVSARAAGRILAAATQIHKSTS